MTYICSICLKSELTVYIIRQLSYKTPGFKEKDWQSIVNVEFGVVAWNFIIIKRIYKEILEEFNNLVVKIWFVKFYISFKAFLIIYVLFISYYKL